jgi:hypothetical protein
MAPDYVSLNRVSDLIDMTQSVVSDYIINIVLYGTGTTLLGSVMLIK